MAVGLTAGRLAGETINRITLDAAGLYPVFTGSVALLTYGAAATLGGSGFLAVYIAGVVLGSRRLAFRRGVYLFQDGLAWVSQIAMFVLLGLLVFPSRLDDVALDGLLIALLLMFVARPIAVWLTMLPMRVDVRETAFVSWERMRRLMARWLPVPHICHPYPNQRLAFATQGKSRMR